MIVAKFTYISGLIGFPIAAWIPSNAAIIITKIRNLPFVNFRIGNHPNWKKQNCLFTVPVNFIVEIYSIPYQLFLWYGGTAARIIRLLSVADLQNV